MTLPGLVAANNLSDVVDRERAWDNLGSSVSTNIPIPSPSLDLNFASNKSLVDDISGNNLITFSRASTGTFVGSNGLIQTAASGAPRFDHNPATGESLGLLVEEARTNLVTYSEQLNNVAWSSISAGTPVVTLNALAAPDGTITGDLIVGNNINTWIANNAGAVSAGQYSFSVWLKSDIAQTADIFMSFGVTDTLTCSVTTSWQRFTLTATRAATAGLFAGINVGNAKNIYVWGAQFEAGSFPTSYIPTVASTVTRAAEIVSITGANFSSWYRQDGGTILIDTEKQPSNIFYVGMSNANFRSALIPTRPNSTLTLVAANYNGINVYRTLNDTPRLKWAIYFSPATIRDSANGNAIVSAIGSITTSFDRLSFAGLPWETGAGGGPAIGAIRFSRFTYWAIGLSDVALQYITSASGSASSTTYPYTFTIKGKDTLALNSVSNASTRDFVFIKGLSSSAQSRLTTAAQQVASGTVFQDAAMLKASPTTSGNYLFSSGITLSGVSTRINGTPALSIATSPFSGSTATASILLRELQPQTNWRITEPMPSGTIASPEFAIPFETNDFVLFMKAGQN